MIRRSLTVLLILFALVGAFAGYQTRATSILPPANALSDSDEKACENGGNAGSGSSNSGSGGSDDCEEDDSGRGRGRGRGRGGDDDGSENVVPPAGGDQAIANDVVVRIIDRGFSPASVSVAPGQSVTFVNEDDDEHTATGDQFDTGTIAPGGSATVTLATAGAFDFICIFHPEMQGTVMVEGDAVATPAASPEASPAASPAASPVTGAQAETATIVIQDFTFDPPTLEIAAGTTVTWTNNDTAPHTATADDGTFETDRLNQGQSGRVTFDAAGTFAYHCDFHPEMVGTIVVR